MLARVILLRDTYVEERYPDDPKPRIEEVNTGLLIKLVFPIAINTPATVEVRESVET